MKNFLVLLLVIFVGCSDYLDKEPLALISEDLVFEDPVLVSSYLADIYNRVDFSGISGNPENTNFAMIASMGGEGRSYGGHHPAYRRSTDVITAASNLNGLDYWNYNNIRECNNFIERISESVLESSIIEQRSAEVRFLRAYMYFQMVIRYGGVPIVTEVLQLDAAEEDIYVFRNSEKEVYDFIISELDAIAQVLPPQQSGENKGRPSKMAALALKSRAALYAASIAKFGQQQLDGLLGFPSGDVAYYAQLSYDASQAIITSGYHTLYDKYPDPTENFQNLFLDESSDNSEIIMAEVYDYSKNRAHGFTMRSAPHDFSNTFSTMLYLYDFTERFEFEDGSPGTSISREQIESQEWSPDQLWNNRDPRFKASVFYPESPWKGGNVYFHSGTLRNGEILSSGTSEDGWPYKASARNTTRTGFMVRKRTNENIDVTPVFTDDTDHIVFRLGEIYLNLAEAAFYLGQDGEALVTLNDLRQRAGMPPKLTIDMDIIQNERLVELTWEDQSYWDIRRWRIAKEVLDGKRMQGLKYIYNYDTKLYQITFANGEGIARIFLDHNYYLPLGVDRVLENPNLVENPGY